MAWGVEEWLDVFGAGWNRVPVSGRKRDFAFLCFESDSETNARSRISPRVRRPASHGSAAETRSTMASQYSWLTAVTGESGQAPQTNSIQVPPNCSNSPDGLCHPPRPS